MREVPTRKPLRSVEHAQSVVSDSVRQPTSIDEPFANDGVAWGLVRIPSREPVTIRAPPSTSATPRIGVGASASLWKLLPASSVARTWVAPSAERVRT